MGNPCIKSWDRIASGLEQLRLCGAVRQGYLSVSGRRSCQGGDLWSGARPLGPFLKRMLRAHLFDVDKDYIVRNRKIIILSPNTGRPQEKSRWSDGIHQVSCTALCREGAV